MVVKYLLATALDFGLVICVWCCSQSGDCLIQENHGRHQKKADMWKVLAWSAWLRMVAACQWGRDLSCRPLPADYWWWGGSKPASSSSFPSSSKAASSSSSSSSSSYFSSPSTTAASAAQGSPPAPGLSNATNSVSTSHVTQFSTSLRCSRNMTSTKCYQLQASKHQLPL